MSTISECLQDHSDLDSTMFVIEASKHYCRRCKRQLVVIGALRVNKCEFSV